MKRVLAGVLCALAVLWALAPQAGAGTRWQRVHGGQVPAGAVKGGYTPSSDLYICRGRYKKSWHIGKTVNGKCNIGWGGREVVLNDYEVLVGDTGVRWQSHGRGFPSGSVAGGRAAGSDLYVCRCYFRDGTHIGKVVNRRCNIGWGGKEMAVAPYEVLTGRGLTWRRGSRGKLPRGAVGGGQVRTGELYVCRGHYRDGVHPGKYWQGRCYVGWGGQEVGLDDFEILTAKSSLHWIRVRENHFPASCRKCVNRQCVCRGAFKDGVHIGKTVNGKCNIGWGGREHVLTDFEVLLQR